MKNLLVPIDFSDATERIVATAKDLALSYGAKVWLLHCAGQDQGYVLGEIPPFVAVPDEALPGRYPDEYRKLAALTASLRSKGIDAELIFVGGSPSNKILAAAEEHQADLLVIGSHGHGAMYELLMGSVTRDVVHRADVPILLIPSKKRGEDRVLSFHQSQPAVAT